MTDNLTPPQGFELLSRKSPLTEPWQPIYARANQGALHLGVWVRAEHCNSRGFVHGGLTCALADNAMGYSVHRSIELSERDAPQRGAVTISIAVDYIGSARIGQWFEVHPRVLRIGSQMAFCECQVTADDNLIARANATFRLG